MRVSVVGSWSDDTSDKGWELVHREGLAAACRELGSAIVQEGHRLIAGSDRPHTADFHAVEGALAELTKAPVDLPPIVLLYADETRATFGDWQGKAPEWVTLEQSPEPDWRYAKLFQVKSCDCLIAIGGAEKTFEAGLAAAVAGKLVIPIGSFGGGARRLNELFRKTYEQWRRLPSMALLGQSYSAPWSDHLRRQVIALLRREPKILIIHGRRLGDRDALKNLLQHKLQLPEPMVMVEKFQAGISLPEKWQMVATGIDGAIAIATPDDVGGPAASDGAPQKLEPRARENVWLETGWFWGRLGRDRVLILRRQNTTVPSDLKGVEDYEYMEDPAEQEGPVRHFVEAIRRSL